MPEGALIAIQGPESINKFENVIKELDLKNNETICKMIPEIKENVIYKVIEYVNLR